MTVSLIAPVSGEYLLSPEQFYTNTQLLKMCERLRTQGTRPNGIRGQIKEAHFGIALYHLSHRNPGLMAFSSAGIGGQQRQPSFCRFEFA